MKPATAKSKGRDTENRLIAYLRSWGLKVERRRLTGVHDCGDVAGWNTEHGSVAVECKSAATWRVMTWLAELDAEAENAAATTGFVVARPKGKPDPEDWVVLIRLPWFMDLMRLAGYIPDDQLTAALTAMRTQAIANRGISTTALLGLKEAMASVALDGQTQSHSPTVEPPTFRGAPSDGRVTGWKTP